MQNQVIDLRRRILVACVRLEMRCCERRTNLNQRSFRTDDTRDMDTGTSNMPVTSPFPPCGLNVILCPDITYAGEYPEVRDSPRQRTRSDDRRPDPRERRRSVP